MSSEGVVHDARPASRRRCDEIVAEIDAALTACGANANPVPTEATS